MNKMFIVFRREVLFYILLLGTTVHQYIVYKVSIECAREDRMYRYAL